MDAASPAATSIPVAQQIAAPVHDGGGGISLRETGVDDGYDAGATSAATAADQIPSVAVDDVVAGAQIPGQFIDYFTGATAQASSYVEDARERLAFTYAVTDNGAGVVHDIAVSGSLAGAATCPESSLNPGQTETCGGPAGGPLVHVTTAADIEEAAGNGQRLVDLSTVVAVADGAGPVAAQSAASFTAPVYLLDSVPAGTPLPNSRPGRPLLLNPCRPGRIDQSACIDADLRAVVENNSPLQSRTADPDGGTFLGNVSPSAVPVVLDLGGETFTVDEGIRLPYPCSERTGDDHSPLCSLRDPPIPRENPDRGFTYSARNEADPGASDIWIENGTLTDPAPEPQFHPVIETILGNNIYLSDVGAVGTNRGVFTARTVNNAGLRTSGTINLVLNNFRAFANHGDGIDLEPFLCGRGSCDCARTVVTSWDPLTTDCPSVTADGCAWSGRPDDTDATEAGNGRDAVAAVGVTLSTFDNLVFSGEHAGALNAESDSLNTNPGSMTFNTLYMPGMAEFADTGRIGPVTINNWVTLPNGHGQFPGNVLDVATSGLPQPWAGAVTVNDSRLGCSGFEHGRVTACIMGGDIVAAPGTSSCGSRTPWRPGHAWVEGAPCRPGVVVNDSAIDVTQFASQSGNRLSSGVWNQFNDDCVVDVAAPPGGAMNHGANRGVTALMNGHRFAQITDDGETFGPDRVCGALAADPPAGTLVNPLARTDQAYGVTWFRR